MSEISEKIKSCLPEVCDFLCKMIDIQSLSGKEEKLVQFIVAEFNKLGLEMELLPLNNSLKEEEQYCDVVKDLSYTGRHNVAIKLKGKSEKDTLVLNTHMDIVPPAREGLGICRHEVRDNLVYGRGACDAKGQIATMYLLMKILKEMNIIPPNDILLHIVVEEEIGGNGTLAIMQKDWSAGSAIIMEPTELAIMTAARGAVWFHLDFHSLSGHSGQARTGESALEMAIEAMGLIRNYHNILMESAKNIAPYNKYPNPMPLNFGVLKSGEWPATIPSDAVLEGVMGFLPNKTAQTIKDEIIQVLESSRFKMEYEIDFFFLRDPHVSICDSGHIERLMNACTKAGLDKHQDALLACCDAWFYGAEGIPAFIFGPGSLKQAHTSNEYVDINQINSAAEVLFYYATNTAN